MTTIRDVAEHAQVSVSTASRILSNSTKETYSAETRERVLEASRVLGYRPNFAARALASGKTHIIAAIFARVYDTPFTARASLEILAGIESFCSDHGYHMLIASPRIIDGLPDPHFVDLLNGGYLEGAIVDGHFGVSPIMDAVNRSGIPTVALGKAIDHPYSLRSDNVAGGRLMMTHLLEEGHCRIGIIGIADIHDRMCGVREAAEGHGIDFGALPIEYGDFSEFSGEQAAERLMTAHPDLTALLALNDRMAIGAIHQLHRMNYRVPEDVSVIGYDDLKVVRDINPPLTTINHRLSEWGSTAMQMLLRLLDGETPESVVFTPRLVVRGSTTAIGRAAN